MKYVFIIFLSCLFFTPFVVNAEDTKSFKTPNSFDFDANSFGQVEKTEKMPQMFVTEEPEVTVVEDEHAGEYLVPDVQNLSKLYWKKNTLDINNDTAIDNFLKINECKLYTDYYNDDFEWKRIRSAARGMLETNKDSFSDRFKFLLPVELGRYDSEKKGFPLENNSAFIDLRRVEMGGGNNSRDVCGDRLNIDFYPRNIVLALSKPFNYDFVPVDEHIAQAFLIRRKYEDYVLSNEHRLQGFERIAYARLRIHLTSYQGSAKGRDNSILAVMFGKIEGIDFFEDPYEEKLLQSVNFD